ncbi:MAG: hypothetical protein SGJ20_08195 [Planctomycetota bacterium]|nr:hypothetical protein [Planctomycetota bacterium]
MRVFGKLVGGLSLIVFGGLLWFLASTPVRLSTIANELLANPTFFNILFYGIRLSGMACLFAGWRRIRPMLDVTIW